MHFFTFWHCVHYFCLYLMVRVWCHCLWYCFFCELLVLYWCTWSVFLCGLLLETVPITQTPTTKNDKTTLTPHKKRQVLYILGTRLRCRPRNRWQDEVREDGRIVGGEEWQEKVHNREEWKKVLRRQEIVAFCTCQWNEWIKCSSFIPMKCHYVSA